MGRTNAKSNTRSGNITDGLRHKDLKLTVIFAPCSRSELLDIYNPIEFPYVDREMRVLIRQLAKSGDYVAEQQDKVIFINCSSVQLTGGEEGALPTLVGASLIPKLKRSIQLIHELLDYWHGYTGTVFTTFCSFTPLEGLMEALQNILKCPSNGTQTANISFASMMAAQFSDAFDLYYEWTFVNKHTSIYEAEYKYEVHIDKTEEDILKEDNDRLIDSLPEKAKQKFLDYQNAEGTTKTTKRFGLEDFVKYNPEYDKYLRLLDKNNRRLKEIDDNNKAWAEKWSHKSKAERKGYVKQQLDKQYDPQLKAVEEKYPKYLALNIKSIQEIEIVKSTYITKSRYLF